MKKSAKIWRKLQFNNKGISLTELIVAIAILAIIIVPLLHSFVSAARLNGVARNTLEATSVAENIMEEFNDTTVDKMVTKYAGVVDSSTGIVTFENIPHSLLDTNILDSAIINVTLNPLSYTNENKENVVNLQTITSSDCAIYSMLPTYDDSVAAIFANYSASASTANPTVYTYKDATFFKENLDRTIVINVLNMGTGTNALGESIPLARVELYILYEWKGTSLYVLDANRKYQTETKELFSNTVSKIPMQAIYLMYTPRYAANVDGKVHKDNVQINNYQSVNTQVYVIRQDTGMESTNSNLSKYITNKGTVITVSENNTDTSYSASTRAAITLRTNLHAVLLNSASVASPTEIQCGLVYRNQTGTKSNALVSDVRQILQVHAADGRTLDNSANSNRIYKMNISIYKSLEDYDNGKPSIASLDGTKIQ